MFQDGAWASRVVDGVGVYSFVAKYPSRVVSLGPQYCNLNVFQVPVFRFLRGSLGLDCRGLPDVFCLGLAPFRPQPETSPGGQYRVCNVGALINYNRV